MRHVECDDSDSYDDIVMIMQIFLPDSLKLFSKTNKTNQSCDINLNLVLTLTVYFCIAMIKNIVKQIIGVAILYNCSNYYKNSYDGEWKTNDIFIGMNYDVFTFLVGHAIITPITIFAVYHKEYHRYVKDTFFEVNHTMEDVIV